MKAVLLGRDGVTNSLVYREDAGLIDSLLTASQFKLLSRVPAAIRRFNELGLKVAKFQIGQESPKAKGHLR